MSSKSSRVKNIQVPGADPAPAPVPEKQPDADLPQASSEDAKPEVHADNQRVRSNRDIHSSEIDPTTLTAPVLCKDGYLCPAVPEKK